MRLAFLALAMSALAAAAPAPSAPDGPQARFAQQVAAMQAMRVPNGIYEGESVAYPEGGGAPVRGKVVHRVGEFIGGSIKVMEGRNYAEDGTLRFNGMMVLSYDPVAKQYKSRSFTMGGGGETALTLTPSGYYFDIPMAEGAFRRVNIMPRADGWEELVQVHRPGQPPATAMRMILKRVADSDWPNTPVR